MTTNDNTLQDERERLWQKRLAKESALGVDAGDEFAFHHLGWRILFTSLACFLRTVGLWKRGRANACAIAVEEETLCYRDLPEALEGCRILHLSDFHFSSRDTRHQRAVLDALQGLQADVCLMTGDFRFGHYGPTEHVFPILRELLESIDISLGHFAVLGNHDSAAVVPGLEDLGITVLNNRGVAVSRGGASIWIGGTDDPHKYRAASVECAMEGAPEDAFRIALVHAPECIPEAAAHGAKLYLTGHTHSGQICLPLWGPVRLNARCERRYTRGRWRFGDMEGNTSSGLGNTDLALRFGAPPRAHLFTLMRAEALKGTP